MSGNTADRIFHYIGLHSGEVLAKFDGAAADSITAEQCVSESLWDAHMKYGNPSH
ncbi:hypothetical protein OAV24_02520 [Gammaproteobacteria bacterium]|nr:hypothetical protein [Gammaproteobacteria bacterium]